MRCLGSGVPAAKATPVLVQAFSCETPHRVLLCSTGPFRFVHLLAHSRGLQGSLRDLGPYRRKADFATLPQVSETFKLGRVAGIPIGMNWSVLLILWLISWSLAGSYFPAVLPGHQSGEYWAAGIVGALLFFASLLAHELGHAIVATHLDIQVEGITLWLFGGVSKLNSEATSPRDEFAIAACGPLISIGLSLGFLLAAAGLNAASAPEVIVGVGLWLGTVNGILALFNLAPAAPLDGGHLLMAWLWHKRGNRLDAVVSAANAGRIFGYALIVVGLLEFAAGLGLGGLWLVFLGWFLLSAAQFEKSQAVHLNALAKHLVRELMTADPVVVPENLSVADLLDDFVLSHRFSSFPVQASDGQITGLVTLAQLRLVPAVNRERTCVKSIQTPISELVLTTPDERADQLASRVASSADGRALVMDHGTLVGIVSSTDVMRSIDRLMIRQEA